MPKKDIKNIHAGHRERLREATEIDTELTSFSDFTVLEYVLSFIIPRKDTNVIAHELIDQFNTLYGVFSATADELYKVKNMTKNAARLISQLMHVVRRAEMSRFNRKCQIAKIDQAVEFLRPYFFGRNSEHFYVVMLDLNNKLIGIELVSKGMANFTSVDLNVLLGKVTRTHACKIILAHNHPAGNIEPSPEDIATTESLSVIITGMGKELIDHLIFADDEYYSFFDHNLLNRAVAVTDKLYNLSRYSIISNRRSSGKYVLENADSDDIDNDYMKNNDADSDDRSSDDKDELRLKTNG